MSICAPKPFGSKFLKGGYSYWPLWWYGQKSKLHDMSGHGNDLTPSGAYFDGQGYCFDGVDDYLINSEGEEILDKGTEGSWHSVYLTEGNVPTKGSIWGTGTVLKLATDYYNPYKIKGKIVLRPEYCPNLEVFKCYANNISAIDVGGLSKLKILHIGENPVSTLNSEGLISLTYFNSYLCTNLSDLDLTDSTLLDTLRCDRCNISVLDVSGFTLLTELHCYNNNISLLDTSALSLLKDLQCHNNSMDQSMVDTVLCAMDNNGAEDGYLDIAGNAEPSDLYGIPCKESLVDKGWTVNTD